MSETVATRDRVQLRSIVVLVAGVACVVIAAALSLAVGARQIDVGAVLDALFVTRAGDNDAMVVRELRVPRTVLGLVAGAALGLAGALMQGLARNPLADPGLLGVNAGASLFVVLGISVFGVTTASGQVWFAFAGAAAATIVVYVVDSGARGPSPLSLTLAGTAVSAALTSVITLVLLGDLETLNQYRFWSVGSLVGRDLSALAGVAPFLAVGMLLSVALGRSLNALALGEDVARGLGAHLGRVRVLAAVAIVLLCGGATALVGPIVFVGLVAPHLARRVVGSDYRLILLVSALVGAVLLTSADVIGRIIVPPAELEAGLVVALIGAPVMIALVRGRRAGAL